MSTNMTGFRWFSKIFALLCFVASALEGLKWGNASRHCEGKGKLSKSSCIKGLLGYLDVIIVM